MTRSAILALADGTVFHGESVGVDGLVTGEVVFNTAMTGYQEILTDPSYCKQIVTLTYPHIGNTGCNAEDNESGEVYAAGLVVRDCFDTPSNWRAEQSLPEFLASRNVVAISGLDTRKLTRILRDKGAQSGCIISGRPDAADAIENARRFSGLEGMDLASIVSCVTPYEWEDGIWQPPEVEIAATPPRFNVVAYDFGVKHNILRMLVHRGCRVTVVPARTRARDVLEMKPDGVFLSNGPGDPAACRYAVDAVRDLINQRVPVFGICLGFQLLALASDARTIKMKFGHHGANHPVLDIAGGHVMISSQNHGFAVDPESLSSKLEITHRSLFDDSLQGLARKDSPAFGFQGHPEASPGPHDVAVLFDRFVAMMSKSKRSAGVKKQSTVSG